MKKIPIVIRIILTLVLLFAVYVETGIWTAISLGLVFAAIEVLTILINTVRQEWRKMVSPTAKDMEFIDSLLNKKGG